MFVHLHVHTEHSFLDGVPTIPDLCDRVLELGQTAVAVTDHGEVSGHYKLQKEAVSRGIQPIFGIETYFVDDVSNRIKSRPSRDYDHMTLLAVSQEGLENLWRISSRAYIEGFYYKPRIDFGILRDHSEGIIATGGCLGGCVPAYLLPDSDLYNPSFAIERISRLMNILDGRFYLELHTFPTQDQRVVNLQQVDLANRLGIPLIAVSDSHYLRPDDWKIHELLIAAQMKLKWNDPKRYQYGPGALHVLSEDEVCERLNYLPIEVVSGAIENTCAIAEMSRGVSIDPRRSFPIFLSNRSEDESRLRSDVERLADVRFDRLRLNDSAKSLYRKRLNDELELVIAKGYAGYFLIVADVIRWAKDRGILIGPGRGSVGGSLLSFVLGITEIDPVRYGLLFERFLDAEQLALPDIDVDVPQLQRHEVLEYLSNKYNVVAIGTLNTLAPRMLLNDLCRLLDIPHEDNDQMGRIISSTPDLTALNLTWTEVQEINAEAFRPWMDKYPMLFDLMDALQSHYRHASVHAAGVVVSRDDFMGRLPLRKKSDIVSTQFPQEDVEELGYVKMDFLGLRTLSTISKAWQMAVESYERLQSSGEFDLPPRPIHPYEWQYHPEYYEDRRVYESLWSGKNVGVFQLDTEGFSRIVQRYRPASIEEMCVTVSLFRPGITRAIDPDSKLNLVELFLQKREGRLPVTYRHDLLKPILEETYGSFLYQEQVMAACRDLAGFSPSEQTRIRKILGKLKSPDEMKKFKDLFVSRAKDRGIMPDVSESIWGDMEAFGIYSFNKSHGLAYGMLTYWTGWFKYHYPAEFMLALFQTDPDNIKAYNRECRRLGIPLLGPDVNESGVDFELVGGRIRYGLQGVKFVDTTARIIIDRRPYLSVEDCLTKLSGTRVNKRVLESLILVGALDSIVTPDDRIGLPESWSATRVALWKLFRSRLKLPAIHRSLDEGEIFRIYLPRFTEYAESLRVDDRGYAEVNYLGENVTTLPFGDWLPLIAKSLQLFKERKGIPPYVGIDRMMVNRPAMIGGIIREVREFKVRKAGANQGRRMYRFSIEYPVLEDGKVVDIDSEQVIVFPNESERLGSKLVVDEVVVAEVTKLKGDGGICLKKLFRVRDALGDGG